jgi:hypothetical protein
MIDKVTLSQVDRNLAIGGALLKDSVWEGRKEGKIVQRRQVQIRMRLLIVKRVNNMSPHLVPDFLASSPMLVSITKCRM